MIEPLSTPEVIHKQHPVRSARFMGAKRLLQAAFLVWGWPRWSRYRIARAFLGPRALTAASESVARIPGLRGVYLRQAFYQRALAACGKDVYFGWMSVFSMPETRVGERVYIGRFCSIGYAELEDEVLLADGVQILSGGHEHGPAPLGSADAKSTTDTSASSAPSSGVSHGSEPDNGASSTSLQSQSQTFSRTKIGRGAWIGAGAVIMADVGAGSVIGAGAVVNRSIPAHCLAVGVPARVVKCFATQAVPPRAARNAIGPNGVAAQAGTGSRSTTESV